MHNRDIPKLPIPIPRSDFVHSLFDIAISYSFPYYLITTSLNLADSFVSSSSSIIPSFSKFSSYPFMASPSPKIYSIELAHTVLVITSKYFTDFPYSSSSAWFNTSNFFIYKLEWEIILTFNWNIPLYDPLLLSTFNLAHHSDLFYIISRKISLSPFLFSRPPLTLYVALLLLRKFNHFSSLNCIDSKLNLIIDTIDSYSLTSS